MRVKLIFTLLVILLTATSCMLPLANRQMLEFNSEASGNRISRVFQGAPLLFSILPLEEPLDVKTKIDELKKLENCSSLANIDILYYNYSFIVIGFEKIRINADCIK